MCTQRVEGSCKLTYLGLERKRGKKGFLYFLVPCPTTAVQVVDWSSLTARCVGLSVCCNKLCSVRGSHRDFVSKEERYACLSVRRWLTLVGYIRQHKSKCLLNVVAAAAAIKGIAIKRPHNTSFMFPFGSVYYLSTHLWDLILLGDFSGFWIQD